MGRELFMAMKEGGGLTAHRVEEREAILRDMKSVSWHDEGTQDRSSLYTTETRKESSHSMIIGRPL